jgi:hypothetical protein
MPTFSTPLALYRHQKTAFQYGMGTARQQWRQIPEGGYRDLKEFTSGSISSATLREAGYPYARRADSAGNRLGTARGASKSYAKRNPRSTKGFAPLLPINRQTSALHNSVTLWHRSSAFTLESSVGFDKGKAGKSLYAVAPKGTRHVVPRGLWVQVRTRGMARNRAYRDVFFKGQRAAFSRP